MTDIHFSISARAAKLIGRENFSNPEGAIIELVKNCYDADAKNCFVVFDILFEDVPLTLTVADFEKISKTESLVKSSYLKTAKGYGLRPNLQPDKFQQLQEYLFSHNSLYIIDNGHGMTSEVIEKEWMTIGTDNKEAKTTSNDGRVLTGAKGIGRFAQDRLGFLTNMWTLSKKSKSGIKWQMDWKQFDEAKKSLSDIVAIREHITLSLDVLLKNRFTKNSELFKVLSKTDFSSGTIIQISGLKDNWTESKQNDVFKSLESLVPPSELQIPFELKVFSLQNEKLFGDVETAFFNDFDYKIEAEYDSRNLTVDITVTRNELDIRKVKSSFSDLFKGVKPPYDLNTLSRKTFKVSKTVFEILKLEDETALVGELKRIGNFSFSFYFLKNSSFKDYPYRDFNSTERSRVLQRFGGMKIYRDSFRVRPYGEIGNDWLDLGERSAQSPAGAGQRIGDWRVGPNQIAGAVKISRVANSELVDKSDRGALIENSAFTNIKKIIKGVIHFFEIDRSTILNKFYENTKRKKKAQRDQQIKREAEKLARKILAEKNKQQDDSNELTVGKRIAAQKSKAGQKAAVAKIIETGIKNIENGEEENAELAQVRTLASLGLIVTSFAHELKDIRENLDELGKLEKIFHKLVPKEQKENQFFTDGENIIDLLKVDHARIEHWVNYSLTAIKKDKRKRGLLQFDRYFNTLSKTWFALLEDRRISLIVKKTGNKSYAFRAFEMDMNTIFNNLISNSIESFRNLKVIRKRVISINFKVVGDKIQIIYSDNGTGLSKIFNKNKEEIFLPFVTSRKDEGDNNIATGLGMYLVKNVVDDNNGTVNIVDTNIGFRLKFEFPVRKK